jgi:class 3 adenylate cyclase
VLLVFCGVTAVAIGIAFWMTLAVAGDSGAKWESAGPPFVQQVVAVDPGSPADRAGLRVGDTLDVRELTPSRRLRFLSVAQAGQRIALPIRRGTVRRTIVYANRSLTQGIFWRDDGWDQVVSVVGEWWSVFVAALIVRRRRERFDALILALLLVLQNFSTAISPANFWVSPWPDLDIVLYAMSALVGSLATVLLATYALQFARPPSKLRRVATLVAYAFAVVGGVQGVVASLGQTFGVIDANVWFFGQPVPALVLLVSAYALPLLCALAALADARGSERARLAWASGSLAVSYVVVPIFEIASMFDVGVHAATVAVDIAVFVTPLGLTYALLNRRLLDVGFVLNRAAVAALLSALGIAAFVLIEWIVSAFFARLGTTGVLVVNIVAAIAVGLFAPALYRRAGVAVDRLLFGRQRRAREAAERVISGLPYVESATVLAKALTRDVCALLDLPCGAVYGRTAGGRFACIEMFGWEDRHVLTDDDLERIALQLVANRSLLRIDDSDRHGGIPAVVLPLESRQELTGFAVYSLHADGVDLDPDERALLVDAARQASRGYDALELAARVESAYQGRMAAEAEARATLRRTNDMLERINEAQARFVPTEFLRFLRRESIADVELGDSTLQTMSILFSDIRSFTTISEGMAPPEIFAFLNEYMRRVGPLVREHNGFIDKYIGDAVMGLFPESASDALRAGVALQKELRIFNAQRERERKAHIAAGVGIHTGQLMLGTVGERGRMETTVIADAVNAASRLESATKTFGCSIVISGQTFAALTDPGDFLLRRLGAAHVKGRAEALEVYECYSGDAPDAIERKLRSADAFAQAVAAFEAGHFAAACETFAAIAADDPDDTAVRSFLER